MRTPTPQPLLFLLLLLSPFILLSPILSSLLPSSEIQSLLRLQNILLYPTALQPWNQQADFCNLPTSATLSVVCESGNTITQLHIVGDKGSPKNLQGQTNVQLAQLPPSFSSESLWLLLSGLPNLKCLQLNFLGLRGPFSTNVGLLSSLEVLNVSSNFFSGILPSGLMLLSHLQTLVLDDNLLTGPLPNGWNSLHSLTTFSASSNKLSGQLPSTLFSPPNLKNVILDSNRFQGRLPLSVTGAENLQLLSLAGNTFSGNLPDLSGLPYLQALNIQQNRFGPDFPRLGKRLLFLAMGRNELHGSIPSYIGSLRQLQQLDLSSNSLFGMPPLSLFSLPRLHFLNMARNHLNGVLHYNLSFGKDLEILDISFNSFTGSLPSRFISSSSKGITVRFQGNCFTTRLQPQRPYSRCETAASASGINPRFSNTSSGRKHVVFLAGVAGGAFGLVVASVVFILIVARRLKQTNPIKSVKRSFLHSNSTAVSPELLSTARYISKLGAVGLSRYRVFSINDLYEATCYFNQSNLLGEGSCSKVYKGRLVEDGSFVAVKCIILKSKQGIKSIHLYLESLAKLRHHHLVSLLGHCLEYEEECTIGGRLFLVFEFVGGGTMRSRIAGPETTGQHCFSWLQRLLAVIGVAKGIQFLHNMAVPYVFSNDIKITNILLDQNLIAKVSDYGLPKPSTDDAYQLKYLHKTNGYQQLEPRKRLNNKKDIFDFGLILLEIALGRPPAIEYFSDGYTVKELANLLEEKAKNCYGQEMLMLEQGPKVELIDPRIVNSCTAESLATVIEIAGKCLAEDLGSRPSIEDVLWNLHYALQVEDASNIDYQDDVQDNYFPEIHHSCNKDMGEEREI